MGEGYSICFKTKKKKKGEGDIETKNNELSLSSLSTVHIYLIESIG